LIASFAATSIGMAGENGAAVSEPVTLQSLMGPGITKVEKMSPLQRSKYLGANLLRVVAACSVSSWTLAAMAAGETIPMLSAWMGPLVEIGLNERETAKDVLSGRPRKPKAFDVFEEKNALHQVGGGAVSFLADLVSIANHFLFDDDGSALAQAMAMPNTKAGYAATAALAKRFYGDTEKGQCASAGRAVSDVLSTL